MARFLSLAQAVEDRIDYRYVLREEGGGNIAAELMAIENGLRELLGNEMKFRAERVAERLWSPEGPLFVPMIFGLGWTLNVGRLVAVLRGATGPGLEG